MRNANRNEAIDLALQGLQDVLSEKIGGYPLLKQHMNIRVMLELEKPAFNVCLEQEPANDLRRRAALLQIKPEDLIKNLILEYLYDFEDSGYTEAS